MAIYKILDAAGDYLGAINRAETATQAIAQFVSDRLEPSYCKCHDEIARFHTAPIGEMGFMFRSILPKPARAVRMREVYAGGGYCIVEA